MKRSNSEKLRLLTLTGVLAALTTVATLVLQIPTATKGYINLGDTVVNIAAWMLGPVYGAVAAGFGSAIADLISGYAIFAPATLIIKALMAVASWFIYKGLSRKLHSLPARIAAVVVSELIMIAGYAVYEFIIYQSFAALLSSASGNLVQAVFGAGASVAIYELLLQRVFRKIHWSE